MRMRRDAISVWIPAFAGMTVVKVEIVQITTVIPAQGVAGVS